MTPEWRKVRLFFLVLIGLVVLATLLVLPFRQARRCVPALIVLPSSGPALEPTPPACIPTKGTKP